jgi:hypothetical protein
MSNKKTYRVIHLPTTVGGNSIGLSKALKDLGLDSTTCTIAQNYFKYDVDIILYNNRDWFLTKFFKKIKLVYHVACKYDIVHYNFGSTIFMPPYPFNPSKNILYNITMKIYSLMIETFQKFELVLFSLLRKKIVVTYQGDDARQGDFCIKHFDITFANHVDEQYYNKSSDNFKRKMIKRMSKYASQILSVNPDLLHVLPSDAQFMPYFAINFNEWLPSYIKVNKKVLSIIHAPTNKDVKGTKFIISAVEELKSEGYEFDFKLITGLSNHEAKRLYIEADLLIDQLLAGWYGGVSVELMALGKPVIAYIRQTDLKFVPKDMVNDMPILNANQFTIQEVLRGVLEMPMTDLRAIGVKGREFVKKWHDPKKISKEIKAIYEGS